jgi:cell division protein FtsB
MALRKREDDEQHDKKLMVFLGAAIAFLLLLWIVFAPGRGVLHYLKLQREITTLNEENERLESRNVELTADIQRLKSDNAYLEKIAREKHGLLKKDEMVFDFEANKKKK